MKILQTIKVGSVIHGRLFDLPCVEFIAKHEAPHILLEEKAMKFPSGRISDRTAFAGDSLIEYEDHKWSIERGVSE
jgi:hypothetical protein